MGYIVQIRSKIQLFSWLIVKTNCSDKAILIFKDTNSQITTQGKRYLGVALGTSQFRDECFMQKINKWVEELHVLSEIAKIEPQDAHTCFISTNSIIIRERSQT